MLEHAGSDGDGALNRLAAAATTHCLTGCAIGEVAGMVIATALGWGSAASIAIAVGLAFTAVYALTALPPESLWVANGDDTVSRIDPATAKVTASVHTCKAPLDLGLADGAVWVPCNADGTLERIDPATAKVTGRLRLKPGIFVAQEAFGDLWVLRYSSTQVWRIRPA